MELGEDGAGAGWGWGEDIGEKHLGEWKTGEWWVKKGSGGRGDEEETNYKMNRSWGFTF